ncbi:MAG: DNA-protecting protein DprA [Candidatus Omnitrophica bacterium]|nr:DNA-protecting protein DprA [Candidatus Omnitrophota bacterium]
MNSLEALIVLSSVDGLGVQHLRKLLSVFRVPEAIFDIQDHRTLSETAAISFELSRRILESRLQVEPRKILDNCYQRGVSPIHFLDEAYPKNLAAIYDPPILLYVKGTLLEEDRFALGVVGSRRASAYGIQVASRFAAELAEKGITIVSGLALGIDRASHEGALRVKGRTIAVLGSGVDVIYPKENRKVYETIIERGAVISESPLGTEPRPFHFPKRNRIIAGLSIGILVVEAGEKSGSLITARLATDEGREVYAIPGRIDSPYSSGTHRLIQEGVMLVTKPDEILEDLYPVLKSTVASAEMPELTDEEVSVYNLINDQPGSPDGLSEKLNLDPNQVLQILTRLELQGKVKRLWGGSFVKLCHSREGGNPG